MSLPEPLRIYLGTDPTHRTCAINGYAFQQDAIRTFNGWQYACFYTSSSHSPCEKMGGEPLFVHLSRRKLPDGPWQTIRFEDYPQTVDDGHNTVQLGICPGDGTIHLSYDHHCDALRYRISVPGVATVPGTVDWSPDLFTPTLFSQLPGLDPGEAVKELLGYVTYPRFLTRGDGDLVFTFRTDINTDSESGSREEEEEEGKQRKRKRTYGYKFLGTHLRGAWNNPYIHGLDVCPRDGRTLHATWVYREFVHYPGWDDPLDTKHKAQAGPNSAANNRDICHAWSADGGVRWCAAADRSRRDGKEKEDVMMIADLAKGESILPTSPGIVAFAIPKGSGLTNQESQAVDYDGGVHVLNRDSLPLVDEERGGLTGMGAGIVRWKHYHLDPRDGRWTQRLLPHVAGACGGKRGQVAVSRKGDLYFVLPHHTDPVLTILKAARESGFTEYELVWRGDGFPLTDPLLDKARLQSDDVLSVLTKSVVGPEGSVVLTVLDFNLQSPFS
ncbi:hypothetical protein F5Y17DRAFT_476616 [Xylariaceae sp. FL0594]|nr:hypothetical protein F5Y17DRAFT_476616 [Xylariaceae sp. FL0594]